MIGWPTWISFAVGSSLKICWICCAVMLVNSFCRYSFRVSVHHLR